MLVKGPLVAINIIFVLWLYIAMNVIVVLWLYDKVKCVWYTPVKCISHSSGNPMFIGICGGLYLSLRITFIVKWNIKHHTNGLQNTYSSVNHSFFEYQAFSTDTSNHGHYYLNKFLSLPMKLEQRLCAILWNWNAFFFWNKIIHK